MEDNELFVFGGFDGKGIVYNDVWALNLNSNRLRWRELNNSKYRREILGRYHEDVRWNCSHWWPEHGSNSVPLR